MRRFKKWLNLKYALTELVLITLGVSVALVVQNWNDRIKESELETKILKELSTSIKDDIDNLTELIESDEKIKDGIDSLLILLEKDVAYDPSVDKLIGYTFWTNVFFPKTHGYETLKSVGINLIKNDSLRIQITSLYEQSYKEKADIIEFGHTFWRQTIPFAIHNFKQFDLTDMIANDFNSLKKNNEFKTILRSLKYFRRADIYASKKTLESARKTVSSIDLYLKGS